MGAIRGCFLVPLSGWEGNTFFYRCELSKDLGGWCALFLCCDPLNLVSYYHFLCGSTSLQFSGNVRAVDEFALSIAFWL